VTVTKTAPLDRNSLWLTLERPLNACQGASRRPGRHTRQCRAADGRCGGRFADLLAAPVAAEAVSALRAAETIGRPLGSASFLDRLTAATGRDPHPKRRGSKPSAERE